MIRLKSLKLKTMMLMLAALCLLLSLPAAANAAEYTRLGVLVSVADGPGQTLNTIKVNVSAGELRSGDTVLLSLPKDFRFNGGDWDYGIAGANVYYGDYDSGCYLYIPWHQTNGLNMAVDPDSGDPVETDIFVVNQIRDNEIKIQVNNIADYPSVTEDGYFSIYLKDVDIPRGFRGAIELFFDAPPGSGFGGGEVAGGRVGLLETDNETPEADEPEEEADEPDEADVPDASGDEKEQEGASGLRAVFTLGQTAYTLNDTEQTMDVAPYAKNGRTYLPVRYVAQSLGIKSSDILWKNGTAAFSSDDKVVSVTVGSLAMTINGAEVHIDAAPEIVSGRTMLPVKWIGMAFDADVSWDAATRQVTVEQE